MSDEPDNSPPPEGDVASYAGASTEPLSIEDAAREIAEARHKALNPTAERAPKKEATAEEELPPEGDADPDAPVIDEEEGADAETEKLPPIERPKSWSKDEDAEWDAIPRARQEKIVANELARDADRSRKLNEAAEKIKAADAKIAQAEQARQQYEAKLPALMQALHNTNNTAFSDIRSQDDADLLAVVEPARWVQWKAHQDRMQATNHELQQAKNTEATKAQSDWAEFITANNALAAKSVPDLADPEKSIALTKKASELLRELEFSQQELDGFQRGEKISPYDHRIQQILFKAIRLGDIEKAPKAVVTKAVPPVQRPGTSKPAVSGVVQTIQALEKKLTTATGTQSIEISAELYALRRKTAAR